VATVHITITPVNDPPVKTAEPTASTPSPDEPTVTGQVFARDPDIGDHLRYSATAARGSVSIDTFGSYTYTPNDAARSAGRTSPTDTVTVTVTDDQGATLTISFQVGIAPFNSAPVKSAESTTTGPTFEHPEVTGHVFATDPDGDHLTYSATVGKGFVDIDDDGVFTYRPGDDARKLAGRPGATGDALKDTVTVAVTDVYGATTMITVPVTVAPAQNVVVDTIMLTNAPSQLFTGPNNTFYVLQGNSVIQINAVTHAVVRTVPLGFSPTDLVITPDGAILASNKGDNSVTKFPAGGGQSQRLAEFLQPTEMVLGSDDKTLYVVNSQVNTVSRVDSTVFQTAEPPNQSTSTISPITALAVSFDGRTIFGMLADKRVIVADVSGPGFTFIETGVQTPASVRMLMSPADKLYVIDPTNGAVEVFTKSLLGYSGSDLVGRGAPSDIALSEFGSRVYVVNKLAGDVTVYDGSNNRLVATVPIGGSPDEVDIDPTGRYLYVSDSATKNVSIIRLDIPAAPDED
jgi:VCBS repeat-containing protein/YVTN family beta-propeller protein